MDKQCASCEKSFHVAPSRAHIKNCSYACNKAWRLAEADRQRAIKTPCACGCGTDIPKYGTATHRRKFVNGHQSYLRRKIRAPRTNHQVGSNHWNWKGGITSGDRKERLRFRKTLQSKVFARDNYTCQVCEVYGVNIQVDHIKPWAEYPELRFDMNNCRTLCMPCHYYVTFKRKMPKGIVWGHNLSRRIAS